MAPPPRKKKSRQPAPTTILALGDDLLREVFLRLPSLPSLVRAALACPAFLRAVRSSPAFRRRFRDLHSPQLLGAFLDNDEPAIPTFAPVLLPSRRRSRPDPDLAAAVRCLDVSLTRLLDAPGDKEDDAEDDEDEEDDEEEDEWSMCGCRDGYVLLIKPRWNTKKVAVYDPATRALRLFPGPPDELFSGESEYTEAEFHLIPSQQGDDRSFRLLCVSQENGEARVAVLSPDTKDWQISPTAGSLQDAGTGTLVSGSVYWASAGGDNIPVLNTATLQFSQIDPPSSPYSSETYQAGETNDGHLCLIHVSNCQLIPDLDVWVRRAGDDGVDTWMKDMTYEMLDGIEKLASVYIIDECPSVNVEAIIGGIVYFSIHQKDPPIWLLSFCLETRELKKLCRIITSFEFCYPYIMAWPPSLVRNKPIGLSG